MGIFDKYLKEYITGFNASKKDQSGGGGTVGAFVEEKKVYKSTDFDTYLVAPSTQEISTKQDTLLKLEDNFKLLDDVIGEDYANWQETEKQLDDLEQQIQEAPQEMQFKLNNDYNKIRDIHNGLVDKIQINTAQQKKIKEEYDLIREGFDKDIEIYNRWATAQNEKEQKAQELKSPLLDEQFDIGEQFTTEGITQRLKDKTYRTGEKEEPTWGNVVKYSLKSGLGQYQASLVNLFRLVDMGVTKLSDPIQNLISINDEDMEKFKEKYGESPLINTTDMLTKIVEDSEKIATESWEQAESKQQLKRLVGEGLRATPQVAGSVALGIGMPVVSGVAAAKPTAEIITRVTQMIPFGLGAMGGTARQIENEYEALGKEAPYYAMVIGGALSGIGEMATELPVFMGVARMLKGGGKALVNKGAKIAIDKYGGLFFEFIKNIMKEAWQEAEMTPIEKGIKQAMGLPQDWSIVPLLKDMGRDAYGGMAMALVLGGIGGSVTGSTYIANKTMEAVDNVIYNKGDVKEVLRKIAELQGIIMEEAEVETLAYRAEEVPGKELSDLKKELAGRMTKKRILLEEIEEAIGKKIDVEKKEDVETALKYIEEMKAEPKAPGKIFEGEAYRADTGVSRKETAQEIVDFEAEELENKKIKIDAEKVAKELGIKLEDVIGKDIVWVTKTLKEAEEYGEAEKIEISKDNVILATDPDGGFLVLQNADKHKAKQEPYTATYSEKAEAKAPKTIKIFHLSIQWNLKNVDPEFMGTGQIGEEKENIGKPGFEKTSAWYTEETPKVEPRFFNNMLYTTEVEGKDIYDWKENPDNLKTQTEIKEAGYKGYKIDAQVRLFEKVDVTREGTPIADKTETVSIKEIEKRIAPPRKTIDIAYDVAKIHNEKEGATFNLYDGDLIGKEKFAVSTYPDIGIEIKGKTVTKEQIRDFIDNNMDLLKDPVNSVGTWYDKESKKTYIDISKTVDTLEEAVALGKEYKQKAVFNLKTLEEIPVIPVAEKAEIPPVKPPVPPKKIAEEPEGEPKKSFEEKFKDAQKEINRLKGIIKTIKGNAEKRAKFKKELVAYIKKNMPFPIQNKMIVTVKNIASDKALEKAIEKIDQYTMEYYTRQYIDKITSELKRKKIEPKKTPSGVLKGKFTPEIQDKLNIIRANINKSRGQALEKIEKLIALDNQSEIIAEEIELLNMVGIKEMDLETLQFTLTNIKNLKKEGRTLNSKKRAEGEAKHEQDRIDTLETLTGKEVEIDKESGKAIIDSSYKTLPKPKKWNWFLKAVDKFFNWQFHLDTLFDKLSVLDKTSKPFQSALSKIGDRVHYSRIANFEGLEGSLNFAQIKFIEAFESTSKKDIFKDAQKLREEIDLGTFKNSKGDSVHFVLNKEQIIKKVLQLDDPTLKSRFEGMFYTEEIENALRGALSKEDLAWVEGQREVYRYMKKRINPKFMDKFGIHFPGTTDYSGYAQSEIGDTDIPEGTLILQDSHRRASILNPSLKTRTKNKTPLKYDEATPSLMNYILQMEHFIAFEKTINDLNSIFKDSRVVAVTRELFGQNILNKINNFIADIIRDGVDKAKVVKWVDYIRFSFTKSVLAKPHLGLKQIPSVLAYMTEMSVTDFVKGINDFWENPIENYRYLIKHSAYARARFREGFERDIHGVMTSDYAHLLSHTHKISDLMMGFVRAGDKFAVMQGMWAVMYSETKGQTKKAGVEAVEDAFARGAIITDRTQPSFTPESLSEGQRGGSFQRLFTMFQTQPNKYFQLIANNARNFKVGRGSRMKAASNIALAWAILPMLFQFIGDGGKWIEKHQLRALILGGFNHILVFGSMIRGMYGFLIKEAYDIEASPVFATLREAEYCLAKIAKWANPDKDIDAEDIQAFAEHFAKGLGQILGLPTPYGVQVTKAIKSGDYRQLLFSEYILNQGVEKKKEKKPYVKSYGGDKYSKYLKNAYNKKSKYGKYLKY